MCDDDTKYKYLTEKKLESKSSTETLVAPDRERDLDDPDEVTETSASPPKKAKSTSIKEDFNTTSQAKRSQSPVVSSKLVQKKSQKTKPIITPQKVKIMQYMDHMSEAQIMSIIYLIALYNECMFNVSKLSHIIP